MKLAYHYSYSFADDISLEIVRRVAGLPSIEGENLWHGDRPSAHGTPVKRSLPARVAGRIARELRPPAPPAPPAEPRLVGLGSIFGHAKPNDVIWGAGINPKWQARAKLGFSLDIRAVRGPLTRKFIREEIGCDCPEVYGDPALLMPGLFPELQRSKNPKHEYTVLLQHFDEPYVQANANLYKKHEVVLCQRVGKWPWRKVVDLILDSKYIVSSSLHGLIIAEAFGIPARWWHSPELPSTYSEHTLKFNDYYMSTGRKPNQFSGSIEDALADGPCTPIKDYNPNQLVDAFPYEFFPGSKRPATLPRLG